MVAVPLQGDIHHPVPLDTQSNTFDAHLVPFELQVHVSDENIRYRGWRSRLCGYIVHYRYRGRGSRLCGSIGNYRSHPIWRMRTVVPAIL